MFTNENFRSVTVYTQITPTYNSFDMSRSFYSIYIFYSLEATKCVCVILSFLTGKLTI